MNSLIVSILGITFPLSNISFLSFSAGFRPITLFTMVLARVVLHAVLSMPCTLFMNRGVKTGGKTGENPRDQGPQDPDLGFLGTCSHGKLGGGHHGGGRAGRTRTYLGARRREPSQNKHDSSHALPRNEEKPFPNTEA